MKNKIVILAILSLAVGLSFFYPQQQADAIPGWGGTDTIDCVVMKCTANCTFLKVSASVVIDGIPIGTSITLENGATYTAFPGKERSCADRFEYCSWDWSCRG